MRFFIFLTSFIACQLCLAGGHAAEGTEENVQLKEQVLGPRRAAPSQKEVEIILISERHNDKENDKFEKALFERVASGKAMLISEGSPYTNSRNSLAWQIMVTNHNMDPTKIVGLIGIEADLSGPISSISMIVRNNIILLIYGRKAPNPLFSLMRDIYDYPELKQVWAEITKDKKAFTSKKHSDWKTKMFGNGLEEDKYNDFVIGIVRKMDSTQEVGLIAKAYGAQNSESKKFAKEYEIFSMETVNDKSHYVALMSIAYELNHRLTRKIIEKGNLDNLTRESLKSFDENFFDPKYAGTAEGQKFPGIVNVNWRNSEWVTNFNEIVKQHADEKIPIYVRMGTDHVQGFKVEIEKKKADPSIKLNISVKNGQTYRLQSPLNARPRTPRSHDYPPNHSMTAKAQCTMKVLKTGSLRH